MRVHIRYFAALREVMGRPDETLELPDSATVADASLALVARTPALRAPLASCVAAVNRGYVTPDVALADGDELVFIPPLGGG